MIYNKEKELKEIRKQFKKMLIDLDLTLKGYCEKHNVSYDKHYKRLFTYKIKHDEMNDLIQLEFPNKELIFKNGKFSIENIKKEIEVGVETE